MLTHILTKFREPTKELREKLLIGYTVLEKLGPVATSAEQAGFSVTSVRSSLTSVVFENLEYGMHLRDVR